MMTHMSKIDVNECCDEFLEDKGVKREDIDMIFEDDDECEYVIITKSGECIYCDTNR